MGAIEDSISQCPFLQMTYTAENPHADGSAAPWLQRLFGEMHRLLKKWRKWRSLIVADDPECGLISVSFSSATDATPRHWV
jgi:hypothetical protein